MIKMLIRFVSDEHFCGSVSIVRIETFLGQINIFLLDIFRQNFPCKNQSSVVSYKSHIERKW